MTNAPPPFTAAPHASSAPRDTRARFTLLVVVIIAIAGAFTKARAVPAMVTHIDDVGVANTIRASQRASTPELVKSTLQRPNRRGPLSLLLKGVVALGGAPLIARLSSSLSVSREWTYAPAQFLLTGALLHRDQDYQQTVERGRLPSLLFASLVPLLVALVGWRIGGEHRAAVAILAAAVSAASLELTLHAAQMENYALSTLGSAALLYLLVAGAHAPPTPKRAFLEGCALAVLCWCQYQFLFMLPAFAVTRAWQWRAGGAKQNEIMRGALWAALPLVVSSAAIYHYFLYLWAGAGVSWNAGPRGEYLFTIPAGTGFATALAYTLRFFENNTLEIVTAMTAFVSDRSSYAPILGATIAALATLGLWHLARSRDRAVHGVALLSALLAATWTVLIVAKALTLGPTRHALIWLPFLALFAAIAVTRLANDARRALIVSAVLALGITIVSLRTTPTAIAERTNPFVERELVALADSARADVIISYNCTADLLLMPSLERPLLDKGCTTGLRYGTVRGTIGATMPARLLLINGTAPMTDDDYRFLRRSALVMLKRPILDDSLSRYRRTDVRAIVVPGSTEWKRGLLVGGAGLFATVLERK